MGYSWRLGITHYLSGMNDIFSSYGCICLRMGGQKPFSDPSGDFRILVWGGADLGYSNKGSNGNQ